MNVRFSLNSYLKSTTSTAKSKMVIEEWKKSTIATKFPTYRNSSLITTNR